MISDQRFKWFARPVFIKIIFLLFAVDTADNLYYMAPVLITFNVSFCSERVSHE